MIPEKIDALERMANYLQDTDDHPHDDVQYLREAIAELRGGKTCAGCIRKGIGIDESLYCFDCERSPSLRDYYKKVEVVR